MKKSIRTILAGALLVPVLSIGLLLSTTTSVFAGSCADGSDPDPKTKICCDVSGGAAGGVNCVNPASGPDTLFGTNGAFTTIINTLLFVIGSISVVMLIYGGIRYTISGGDKEGVTAAKNTILYAIIGLVVATMAFAIVSFFQTQFTK